MRGFWKGGLQQNLKPPGNVGIPKEIPSEASGSLVIWVSSLIFFLKKNLLTKQRVIITMRRLEIREPRSDTSQKP